MCSNLGRIVYRMSGAFSIPPVPSLLPTSTSLLCPGQVLVPSVTRNYAARKGTRERKAKEAKANKAAKKHREEAEKAAFERKKMLSKLKAAQVKPILPNESERETATDNVFRTGRWKWPVYDVCTAVNNFKEVHHPTMFDNPKALIKAYFELDLSTKKKTQFLGNMSGVIELPYFFDSGKPIKTVCVFSNEADLNAKALEAGALVAVGLEGLKLFQEGNLDPEDYDVILAHPDILPELTPIRGLISKKFPNIKKGTVGFDLASLVKKFRSGIDYNMTPSPIEPKLGMIHVPIGTVDMNPDHLDANFKEAVRTILAQKPLPSNQFITAAGLTSDHSNERFKIKLEQYLRSEDTKEEGDQDEASKEAITATA